MVFSFLFFLVFLYNISLQHFFRGLWSQQEFPSSETGLTYTIARAGLDSCRRRHHQTQAVTPDQHQQQQLQRQSQRKYGTQLNWYKFPTKITFFPYCFFQILYAPRVKHNRQLLLHRNYHKTGIPPPSCK